MPEAGATVGDVQEFLDACIQCKSTLLQKNKAREVLESFSNFIKAAQERQEGFSNAESKLEEVYNSDIEGTKVSKRAKYEQGLSSTVEAFDYCEQIKNMLVQQLSSLEGEEKKFFLDSLKKELIILVGNEDVDGTIYGKLKEIVERLKEGLGNAEFREEDQISLVGTLLDTVTTSQYENCEAIKERARQHNAANIIQDAFRGHLKEIEKNKAAVMIQAAWRGHVDRARYLELRGATRKIQETVARIVVPRRNSAKQVSELRDRYDAEAADIARRLIAKLTELHQNEEYHKAGKIGYEANKIIKEIEGKPGYLQNKVLQILKEDDSLREQGLDPDKDRIVKVNAKLYSMKGDAVSNKKKR